MSAIEILSALDVKRLPVKQGRFLKESCKFQRDWKLQVLILKLRVASCELNLELQFNLLKELPSKIWVWKLLKLLTS